jgi:DNA-binding NarL/FixJ family response regulator
MAGQLVLVDDEPGLREAVQAYLEDSGFTVHTATNGKDGWEVVQRVMPDVVISDVMMPQVDGYAFLNTLRSDDRFQALPVIFLTARGMTTDRIQGYTAGCDAYLPKPFDPDELVAIVKSLINRQSKLQAAAMDDETISIQELARQMAEIRALIQQKGIIANNQPTVKHDFTPREQSVLELVVDGLMNKEIARRLETSVRNVEKYVSRLFGKTGTNSRTELVRYALENHLIPPRDRSIS